jgi:hypothetical protein
LVELRRKLPEPTFGFPKPALDDAKRDIGEIATVVELEYELPVLGDEADNRVPKDVIVAGAVAIVTGEKELSSLKEITRAS